MATSADMVDRLFVPWERLGWEYVLPTPIQPSPEADRMPAWTEPPEPDFKARWEPPPGAGLAVKVAGEALGCLIALALLGLWVFLGMYMYRHGGILNAFVAEAASLVVLSIFFSLAVPAVRKARFRHKRNVAYAAYERELADWRERVDRHDEAERRRYAAALRWYPLTPWSGPQRVDVFGGTGDGWASLLVTLGASLLCRGANVLLLDFTEQQVGDALAGFAAVRGRSVARWELPEQWGSWDPFAGLNPDEPAELLADAVHTMRASSGSADGVDGRVLDAELFAAVVSRLSRPWTLRRIAAGARVLRRMYDQTGGGPLDEPELDRLTAAIDSVGAHTERVQSELQFLSGVLDLLAHDEPDVALSSVAAPGDGTGELWTSAELTVVRTGGSHRRRKDLLDRLVFHRVVRGLRDRRSTAAGQDVVVVAGADHIGREGLEDLARQAELGGVRLVLMLERLRGDLHDLLGGRYSATVLMRLGNAREATAAAEFIGRGHKFVLSQLTEQVGTTFTEGTSSSYSVSEGVAAGRSSSLSESSLSVPIPEGGSLTIPWVSVSTSLSVTQSRTETWQDTVNMSVSGSVTDGQTVSRVYEFTVEPTALQSLPPTAFVLVEPGPKGRRVVLGDCNPGITLLDKVAADPRMP